MRVIVLSVVLLAATAAHAEDRKCNKASHCDEKKNYVTNPNEYGWHATTAFDCTPKRGKGFGWKQKKDVLCDCLPDCGGSE